MKRMIVSATMLAVAISGAVSASAQDALSHAKQSHKITVGVYNQAPWGYVGADGTVKGQAVDVAKAVLNKLGIDEIEPVVTEFGALIPGLQARRFDMIAAGLYIRPERCALVAFTNPDLQMGDAMLTLKGNPKNVHGYAQFVGDSKLILGGGRGSIQTQNVIKAGVPQDKLLQFPDMQAATSAILAGRIDAYVATAATISAMATSTGNLERVTPFTQPTGPDGKVIFGYPAVAFRQADSDFRDVYNNELKKLRESGELLKIISPYGFNEEDLPPANLEAAELCN